MREQHGELSATAALLAEPLRPYTEKIARSSDRQTVTYVQSTWRSWLNMAGVTDTATQKVFDAIGTDTVTRPQLRAMAQGTASPEDRLALLIAVLIWGRGKNNGRMRDPIINVLKRRDGERDRVLERTARLAVAGEAAEAYRAWSLRGLRSPFFTKWLWVASSSSAHCSLVLDGRAWRSLGAFGWDSRVASGRRDWPSRYAAYVRDVHQCAKSLGGGIRAEDVEFTLFRIQGNLDDL